MARVFYLLVIFPALLQSQISAVLTSWKTDKQLKGASYGFCAVNLLNGETLAEHNAHEQLIPASTLKVVTTYAALSKFGANYRFETRLLYTGTFDKASGILNGDLVIAGSGDPSLQSEYFGKESVTDIWALALKATGLKEIKGRVIGDASVYERAIPGEWIWADISNYFGATSCGLSFMDNKFRISYNSGASGSEASIAGTSPNYDNAPYQLTSSVIARGGGDEAYVFGDPYSFQKEIKGSIPPGKTNYEVEAVLPDPALLCAQVLCRSLEKTGVICNVKTAASNYTKKLENLNPQVLYTHYSPPLKKIVFYTNLKSNNAYCESLLLLLGNGNAKEGIEAVKTLCKQKRLDTEELFMADGCGLSRANTTTASFISKLLYTASKDSLLYNTLKGSFPVSGKSGTMNTVGNGTFIEGNMHAKTGYINRVRAYCGYVKSRSGKEIAFSVMLNNYNGNAHSAKIELEKFLVALGEL